MIDSSEKIPEHVVDAFARNYMCEHCLITNAEIEKVTVHPLCDYGCWLVIVDGVYHSGKGRARVVVGLCSNHLEVTWRDE